MYTNNEQTRKLVAHLEDYISLMNYLAIPEEDAVKSRAKALLSDLTSPSQAVKEPSVTLVACHCHDTLNKIGTHYHYSGVANV